MLDKYLEILHTQKMFLHQGSCIKRRTLKSKITYFNQRQFFD